MTYRTTTMLVMALFLSLCALTVRRLSVWHDDRTLWTSTIKVSPNKPRVLVNLYRATGDYSLLDKAHQLINVRTNVNGQPLSESRQTWYALGVWAAEHRDPESATRYFENAYR